jgi:hypothetical protein
MITKKPKTVMMAHPELMVFMPILPCVLPFSVCMPVRQQLGG